MRVATLLFYAVASFLLGAIALAAGGVVALSLSVQMTFGFRADTFWRWVLVALTFVAPTFFLALAIVAAVMQRRGRSID